MKRSIAAKLVGIRNQAMRNACKQITEGFWKILGDDNVKRMEENGWKTGFAPTLGCCVGDIILERGDLRIVFVFSIQSAHVTYYGKDPSVVKLPKGIKWSEEWWDLDKKTHWRNFEDELDANGIADLAVKLADLN